MIIHVVFFNRIRHKHFYPSFRLAIPIKGDFPDQDFLSIELDKTKTNNLIFEMLI